MAYLQIGSEKREVENNSSIIEAAQALDIPFGCQNGLCRTCEVLVEEGMENLSEKTEKEINHDLDENHRLCCQLRIKKGTIKVRTEF